MELLNSIPNEFKEESASDTEKFCLDEAITFILKMLFPISPHICEHLWQNFFSDGAEIESSWPEFNEELIEAEEFELIIQVNGKLRGKMSIDKSLDEKTIQDLSLKVDNVKNFINDKEIKKTIYIKEKIINFVI